MPTHKYLPKETAIYTPKEGFERTLIFIHGLTSNGQRVYDKCLSGSEMRPFPMVVLITSLIFLGFPSCFPNRTIKKFNLQ